MVKRKLRKDKVEDSSDNRNKVYSCQQCEKTFMTKMKLKEHVQVHEKIQDKVQLDCNKCEKVYGNICKLRRHDWRCHRMVECIICGEMLESRQKISNHRQIKHQIHTIARCRFFS